MLRYDNILLDFAIWHGIDIFKERLHGEDNVRGLEGKTVVVTGGGGSVVEAVQQTDAEGVARVGSWTLGLTIGTNSLEAYVQGLPPLRFEATGVSGGGGGGGGGGSGDQTFNIDLRIGSGLTASQQAIFRQAVSRWQAVITGDLIHSPVQCLETDWVPRPDFDPTQAAATRRAFLERYCERDVLVCASHFPSPSFGRVVRGMEVADKIVSAPRDARDNPNDRIDMKVRAVEQG